MKRLIALGLLALIATACGVLADDEPDANPTTDTTGWRAREIIFQEQQEVIEVLKARDSAEAFRNSLQWWLGAKQAMADAAWIEAVEYAAAQAYARSQTSALDGEGPRSFNVGSGYCDAQFLATWWGGRAPAAASVCMCESGGNPNAVGGGGAYHGLFQFLMSTFRSVGGGNVYDPADNASAAARLQARSGWGQWPACAARAGLL